MKELVKAVHINMITLHHEKISDVPCNKYSYSADCSVCTLIFSIVVVLYSSKMNTNETTAIRPKVIL